MRLLLFVGALTLPLPLIAHPTQPSRNINRRAIVVLDDLRLSHHVVYVDNAQQTPVSSSSNEPGMAQTYVETATELVKGKKANATFRLKDDHYIGDNGVAHVHFRQTIHDIDVDNGDFNVNVCKDGSIFSYGTSFYTGKIPDANPLTKRDFSDPVAALQSAMTQLSLPIKAESVSAVAIGEKNAETFIFRGTSGTVSEPTAKLVYLIKPDESLVLTWRVETDVEENWLLIYVDAKTSTELHGVVDYVSHATYQVYPWGLNDPTEGERTIITDPWDLAVSPLTWLSDGEENYTTTRGNNGIAQDNPRGTYEYLNNYRPHSPDLRFEYPLSLNQTPSWYINASITQLFYTINTYHDLLYTLGFTEKAGNFQWDNRGLGGKDKDYVIMNAQDGGGTNNANFLTPPDGKPGRLRMYIFTQSRPPRDAVFDAGIAIHEYTHGLSNRLTGGPDNSRCLTAFESASMGEGWGDFMATAIRLRPADTRDTDYGIGTWADNKPRGSRRYVYSTSLETNPLVYTDLNTIQQIHDAGTAWATVLYELLWNLIDKYGKEDGPKPIFDKGIPRDGKYLTMKLVVDAMALQPCNPKFVSGRDAILDADTALTGGANKCEIWTAFAKRGVGEGAMYHPLTRTGSYQVPAGACDSKI
ncbi:Fungalysin/Thermolysin Extracellular metalloproteinase 5 [Aspergillus hancockii]|nr:Fungalysin/Thermolysin Extracellular metalloproteinase 5 [Aspergillus hancockii]